MALRYCFEQSYVSKTLSACKRSDLAVIDTEGHLHKNHIKSILLDMGVTIDDSMYKLERGAEESRQKF